MDNTNLHDNQLGLLYHLAQFNMLDYPSCLRCLYVEGTEDDVALSYAFRPLSRYKYLTRSGDCVKISAKGRKLFDGTEPLIATGGGETESQRIMQVSRVAALLSPYGIFSAGQIYAPSIPHFIPSACWRKINTGILSTARFAGVLVTNCHRLAVYDIGDGSMEWQIRAEGSLFYGQHRATGMMFICHEDKRSEIAQQIIQQTMWGRRHLLADGCVQRDKPAKWSRSPIKLKKQYRQVYLTTPDRLDETLTSIKLLDTHIDTLRGDGTPMNDVSQGDFEHWPTRGFVNPATDLLKYVYLFSALKNLEKQKKSDGFSPLRYALYATKDDRPIFNMYPKLMELEEVTCYAH